MALVVSFAVGRYFHVPKPDSSHSLRAMNEGSAVYQPAQTVSEDVSSEQDDANPLSPIAKASAPANPPSPEPKSVDKKEFKEKLARAKGSELFDLLYSKDFPDAWDSESETLKARLSSELPVRDATSAYDDEVVSRLGILKAIGNLGGERASLTKSWLTDFINSDKSDTWIFQREAMHSLIRGSKMSSSEIESIIPKLDVRTRNTASVTDRQLVNRIVRGVR